MKIELIYLWINRDKHRCFQQMGFNFSPQYSVSYFDDRKEIQINQLDKINVFQTDRIAYAVKKKCFWVKPKSISFLLL